MILFDRFNYYFKRDVMKTKIILFISKLISKVTYLS